MAVAADGQAFQHDRGRQFGVDGPEPPANAGGVFHGVNERQVDLAIEQRRAHLVFGSADGDPAARQQIERCRAFEAEHRHLGLLLARALLDLLPFLRCGCPIRPLADEVEPTSIPGEFHQDQPGVRFGRVLPRKGARSDIRREQCIIGRTAKSQFRVVPAFLITRQNLLDRQATRA